MSRPVPCGAGRLRVACCPDRSPALLAAPTDLRRCLLPHGCSGRRVVCCRAGLLVVPVGGGPPASRPRRELRSARRLEARPGPAAAHRHRSQALRSLRCPPHQWGLVADVARCVVSKPGRALPSPINFARNSPATCSNIEFATLELQCFGVVWCVLLQTSSIQGVFRVDFCPVVTNVVNPSAFSVKMLVFGLRLTTFVTEVLARRCESCWFDDVCNVGRPLVARPGLAAAHGYRSLALPPPAGIGNLSRETGVAFAGR